MRQSTPVATSPGPVGEMRGASAAGGTALTPTATRIPIPIGTTQVRTYPRNFSTAIGVGIGLCPYVQVLKTIDGLATVTDYSIAAQDNDAATDVVLSSLPTLANGGAVYVGSPWPFRGLDVDVDATNGNASVLSAHYWNGTTWVTLAPTDSTANAGATFAQDGLITWTVPTAWTTSTLYQTNSLYWARLTVSAALDASTTLNGVLALPRSTTYAMMSTGMEFNFNTEVALGGHSAIEAKCDAGTANLVVNCFTHGTGLFA